MCGPETFCERIEHAIAILPLDRLWEISTIPFQGPQWRHKWTRLFITKRVPWNSARPDARQSLTRFVNRVVDRLLDADFLPQDADMQTLRPLYMDRVLDTLCTTSTHRCVLLLSDYGYCDCDSLSATWYWEFNCRALHSCTSGDKVVQLRNYAEGIDLDDQDILIAAATMGNLAAVKNFVDKGNNFNDYGKIFSSVWLTVVGTDQDKIVCYLLSQLYPLPTNTPSMRKLDRREAGVQPLLDIYKALLDACLHGKVRTGKLLIDFLSQQGILLRLIMRRQPSRIFRNCMQGDCIELLDHVLNKLQCIPKIELRPLLMEPFFWVACRLGRVEIMRYLLEHQYVSATNTHLTQWNDDYVTENETDGESDDPPDNWVWHIPIYHDCTVSEGPPLFEAARNSQLEAMKVLVEYGAQVSQKPSEIMHSALCGGVTGFRYATVTFLMDNGAVVDKQWLRDSLSIANKVQSGTSQVTLDTALTLITVVAAVKNAGMDQNELQYVVSHEMTKTLRDAVQRVLSRGLEMPVDFMELGKQCVDWLDEVTLTLTLPAEPWNIPDFEW